jgi:hypothetical protein
MSCWRVFSIFFCELDARARDVGEDGRREAPRHPHQQDGRPHRQLGCQEVGTLHSVDQCFASGSFAEHGSTVEQGFFMRVKKFGKVKV